MPREYQSFGIKNAEKFIVENLPRYTEEANGPYIGYRYLNLFYHSNNFEVHLVLDACGEKDSIVLKTINLNASNTNVWNLEPQMIFHKDYEDYVSGLFGVEGKEGSFPLTVINPDVLPRIDVGEKISAQIAAFATHIDLYDTEDELENVFPVWEGHEAIPDSKGKKLSVAAGVIFPLQFMLNHQVKAGEEDDNKPYDMSDEVGIINGQIKKCTRLDCGDEKDINCIFITVDTEYGELEIYTEDDGRDYSAGKYFVATIVVSADIRINEYSSGAKYDEYHLLKLLQDAFERGEYDRLIYALSEECKFTSEYSEKNLQGSKDILEHFNSVAAARSEDKVTKFEYEFIEGEHPILKEYENGEHVSNFSIKVEDKKIMQITVSNV